MYTYICFLINRRTNIERFIGINKLLTEPLYILRIICSATLAIRML